MGGPSVSAGRRTHGRATHTGDSTWEHLVKRAEAGAAAHLTGCQPCVAAMGSMPATNSKR